MRMNNKKVEENAKDLARTVIMSFKDEDRVQGWLKNNKDYQCDTDRVVDKAIVIIRSTLESSEFNLAKYKQSNA